MDDLRAALPGFDPEAPSPPPPSRGTTCRCPRSAPGPPWAMAEMIAAEPAPRGADRASGSWPTGRAAALADAVRDGRRRPGGPVIVTGCGTSEHAALATAEILREAWRAGRAARPAARSSAQAFELAQDPPGGRPRHRRQPRGRHGRDDRGARRRAGARRADGAGHRERRGAGRGRLADIVLATVELDTQLVPHRGLRVADRRRERRRRRCSRATRAGRRPRSRARLAERHRGRARDGGDGTRPRPADRPRRSPTPRTCSSSGPAWTGPRPAS